MRKAFANNWDLYLLLVPVIAYFIIFAYWPMFGVQIAFKDFKSAPGIWGSPWTAQHGLKHFIRFFNSSQFINIVWNTISISIYSLVARFPIPIILALLINELKSVKFKKTVQMVTYAPHFLSTVVLVGMISVLFSAPSALMETGGIVNTIIIKLGMQPIKFVTDPGWFKHLYVWSGIWQSTGWGSIIYIAALAGIDIQQYEAAMVDGATKMQRLIHVTLPGIMPTAITLFILDVGKIMNVGFEKVFLMQNGLNLSAAQVISTYVYDVGLKGAEYSFSTAVGLFNSAINFALLIAVNNISRKVSETSLW
ncbi:MAG: ABC transporter permease subunit [Bacillota bacterium]|nr:ABC transporter permease subunit [Bacillota bacterium]